MSVTTNTDEEWEFSKENIQPLQHGRKPDILKLALREHPDDPIQQQQQAFENELRTYSGDDPLSVWFEYINWIEQNFLKGGRDGHYEHLVKKCVTVFKDDKRYCDDKRFISVWLKFANVSGKPIEVFNYMFSHNIGCYTATFYIAWSWKLEQQDNIKKANQVLCEGVNRNADPVEKLKSYLSEFEIRISRKMSEHLTTRQSPGAENHRSAFSILKTHKKAAPIERTGETVMPPIRSAMTIGHSQPAPKNECESSSKMPFKIYSNEAPTPLLPVQKIGSMPFIFNANSAKENELKPSKWNKVKVKQTVPITQSSSSKNLNFDFHHDEAPQPISTPRPVPKVSNVLRSHQHSKSPQRALFEPEDPMKRPMYDRNKVYGGAEEFSLEEIRAAAWLKKHNLLEAEGNCCSSAKNSHDLGVKKDLGFAIYSDENKQVTPSGNQKILKIKVESPERALLSPVNTMKRPIYDRDIFYKGKEELSFEEIKANAWLSNNKLIEKNKEDRKNFQQSTCLNKADESESHNLFNNSKNPSSSICTESKKVTVNKEFLNSKLLSSQFQQNILNFENQNPKVKSELDFSCPDSLNNLHLKAIHSQCDSMNKQFEKMQSESFSIQNLTENLQGKCSNSTSYREAANLLEELYNGTIANPIDAILKNEYLLATEATNSSINCNQLNTNTNQMKLPFTLFQDPTENNFAQNVNLVDTNPNMNANEEKSPLKFQVDGNLMQNNDNMEALKENLPIKSNLPFIFYEDPLESILKNPVPEIESEIMNDENAENIPPKDYTQNSTEREKSGILTPAQNVMFIPLELQETEEIDLDPEDIQEIDLDPEDIQEIDLDQEDIQEMDLDPEDIQLNKCSLQNETLFPPCNTEQFISAPFISSTPFTTAKNNKEPKVQISEDTYNYRCLISNTKEEHLMPASQGVVDPATEKQFYRPEKINVVTRPISNLSMIMETSKESYKSSASSGSSASATRLSQFDQYHSYEKSNITHKEYSRADTFKEPKPVTNEHSITNIKKSVHVSEATVEKLKVALYENVNDPFDNQLTEKLLESLKQPPNYHKIMDISEKKFKFLKVGDIIEVKQEKFTIESMIAEGAYGKVFVADKEPSLHRFYHSFPSKVALKASKHSNEWELYICFILQERLLHMNSIPDVRLSAMDILAAKKFSDGMILVTEYFPQGTLLDLVNSFKKDNKLVPEPLALYLTLELLLIMLKIHECKIVHTDIKPDNILVRSISDNFELDSIDKGTSLLQFIDFGRSIDLTFFESGVCFTTPVRNRCNEILENKPWVFQLDWCGILDCIHTLVFQDYMKVKKSESGRWCIEKRFKRYQACDIWSPLFDELLNIPACYEEPNISEHVARIKAKILQTPENIKTILKNLRSIQHQK